MANIVERVILVIVASIVGAIGFYTLYYAAVGLTGQANVPLNETIWSIVGACGVAIVAIIKS